MDLFSRLLQMSKQQPGIIRKGKKYVKAGTTPPKGVTLHRGKRGGTYYLIEDKHLKHQGKEHELVRSRGVTKDQFDEITQKHLAAGAESVHFVNKPEAEKGPDGKNLYNIYVRHSGTDKKIAEAAERNKKFGKRSISSASAPASAEAPKEVKDRPRITLYTSNKVGRARNLATERGVDIKKIHELYRQAEDETTREYYDKHGNNEPEGALNWVLRASYSEKAVQRAIDLITAEQPPLPETGPVDAFLLSGKTYPMKGDIKRLFGGKWDRDERGWIIHGKHGDAVKEFAEKHGFDIDPYLADGEDFRKLTGEELRVVRTEKNQRKAERVQGWADKNREKAEASWKRSHDLGEMIPLGQPILVGHHSEKRHRSDLKKIQDSASKAVELGKKAEKQQRQADALSRPAIIAGDAQKKYADRRDAIRSRITPGKTVLTNIHYRTDGTVISVKDKSALVWVPKFNHSESWDLNFVSHAGDEGELPNKDDLIKQMGEIKEISKERWDKIHKDNKKMDQYTRVRHVMEGSMASGRGWVPVKIV